MPKELARKIDSQDKKEARPYPDKLFYKIGEVSRIADVEPYVLRYWETEFPFLKPRKSKSGQRIYVKKDLDLIFQVKGLLYDERFTIEGVRKRLGEAGHVKSTPAPSEKKKVNSSEAMEMVKARLREILKQLD
jgi:DNA-binding transcriptional MerR regulator